MRIQKIIISNRAPFNNLSLDLGSNNIAVLSGINGAGKTTLISYIVDALYELAKKAYANEFEDKPNKYYRISSGLYSIDSNRESIVYMRFVTDDGETIDYIDICGDCSDESYNSAIDLENIIPFSIIKNGLAKNDSFKYWTVSDRKTIEDIFNKNLLTYFPAYRYEKPSFLNDPYQIELSFTKEMSFIGYLPNPIEVTTDLPQIANWIMDIVLDNALYNGISARQIDQVNEVITSILQSKLGIEVGLGIGLRNAGARRIVVKRKDNNETIYPSIFCMSSGELSLLCLFGEIVKQADSIGKVISDVSGIVLVDEIDKHLHIRLQNEIVPRLLAMFPNIQFILSSHSPFLGLGLEASNSLAHSIYDLDNDGIVCPPQDNELFTEVYRMMLTQNEQYYTRFKQLQEKIQTDTKPLVITEGKTDWKHLKAAMKALDVSDLDIDLYNYEDTSGDSKLKQLLYEFARFHQPRKIIGIFDRDNISELKWNELTSSDYIEIKNHVFAFAIPLVNTDEYGEEISIEHYYHRSDLTKTDANNRRLFLGDEFHASGISKDSKYHTRCKGIDKKANNHGIIDDKVYEIAADPEGKNSIALSKNAFADMVLNSEDISENIDFTEFNSIFDVIRKIISI